MTSARPIPGVMFGVTHELDGGLIVREPRVLKVGIGLPKGPALAAHIGKDSKWVITKGYKDDNKQVAIKATRAEAEETFSRELRNAPICPYPRKLPFFTFSKPGIIDGKEQFLPDFDAIESHGPMPTEIDIVTLDDEPFSGMYQMWSATELKCKGDGVNALRVLSMATAEQKPMAEECARAGEKYFPLDGCWTAGCPFSRPGRDSSGKETPSPCKPGGDFKFQLACNIRVGGTAYFHTTGFRSISSIFSSLHRVRTLTGGRLMGIPLKMCLRPFRTNHNGQAATHYAVALEFRAPDPVTLSKRLMESVWAFAPGKEKPVRMIEAPEAAIEEGEEEAPISAEAMVAEFYPETEEPQNPMQAATEGKRPGLADKMARAARQKPAAGPVAVPATSEPTATAESAQPGVAVGSAGPADDDVAF